MSLCHIKHSSTVLRPLPLVFLFYLLLILHLFSPKCLLFVYLSIFYVVFSCLANDRFMSGFYSECVCVCAMNREYLNDL